MTIDGKEDVKERIEISKQLDFTTYKYVFNNGNYYNESVPKWTPTDTGVFRKNYEDTWLENNYWKKI